MLKRPTVITLVLLALAAGLYWYSQQPENALTKILTAGSPPAVELLGTLISPDYAVSGLTLESANGQSVSIQPQNNTWIVTASNSGGQTDPEAAQTAIRNAQALRLMTKVDSAADLAAFGLDKPAYVLTCFIGDGKTFTFKIGNSTVTQNGYYVLKEDGTVVIVSTSEIDTLTNLLNAPPFLPTATP